MTEKKSSALQLFITIAVYFILWLIVPKATFIGKLITALHNPHAKYAFIILLLVGVTALFMAVQIAIVCFFAKIRFSFAQILLVLLGCLVLAFVLMHYMGKNMASPEHVKMLATQFGWIRMLISVLTMLAAASVGYLVALRIKDKNLLLPVVMFAAAIDFWTVNAGPVSHILKKAPQVVNAVSAPIPTPGTGSFMPITFIGPGDFLFMGLLFAAIHRLGMNGRRNYWFVFGFMTAAMLAVLFNLVPFFPALVTLALAVVIANFREFKLSKEEKISIAIVGVLLAATLPLVWYVLKPHEHVKHPVKETRPPITQRK